MEIAESHTQIVLKEVEGRTSLVNSKINRPLRIFSLKNNKACQVVFSNYGGGFVEGDEILMDIDCKANTTTVFSSQANTRVYKSINGKTSRQAINGTLEDDAFVAVLCDPIVLHSNSIFEQKQNWSMAKTACLLVADWFEAGRILNGERFVFESFKSEFKVDLDGEIAIWDKFRFEPSINDANSPAAFLNHSCYLNIFLIGSDSLPKIKKVDAILKEIASNYLYPASTLVANEASVFGAYTKINNTVSLIRCSASNTDLLRPVMKALAASLSDVELLGFDPWHKI
jgi:urease accessory protein